MSFYSKRKEAVERVFADTKEKYTMRYTHHRGLAHATNWVRLKYAAMNLKKLENKNWDSSCFVSILRIFSQFTLITTCELLDCSDPRGVSTCWGALQNDAPVHGSAADSQSVLVPSNGRDIPLPRSMWPEKVLSA